MNITVKEYTEHDIPDMIRIWNDVVRDGIAFPQEDELDIISGTEFFSSQTFCAVAKDYDSGNTVGLYILHPNNIGRCGHIANASYAVEKSLRGKHIGEKLVEHCLIEARSEGFTILQFNAVVESNIHARHLYERLGFIRLGTIKDGFRKKDGSYENICPYYINL